MKRTSISLTPVRLPKRYQRGGQDIHLRISHLITVSQNSNFAVSKFCLFNKKNKAAALWKHLKKSRGRLSSSFGFFSSQFFICIPTDGKALSSIATSRNY